MNKNLLTFASANLLTFAGALGALVFLIIAWSELGGVVVVLFATFIVVSLQDALHGRVIVLSFLPGILLPVFYFEVAWEIFVPVACAMASIYCVIRAFQGWRVLRPDVVYFGLGDVLGLPFALAVVQVILPFWGLIIFAASCAVELPIFLRKKQRRFLPWLCPPIVTAFIIAVIV